MQATRARIAAVVAGGVALTGITGVVAANAIPDKPETIPAAAPADGYGGKEKDSYKDKEADRREENGDADRRGRGTVQVNERVYPATPGTCIAFPAPPANAVSNNSRERIAVFNGPTCAGTPVAIVGAGSDALGVFIVPPLGSFRVL
ncbi:hypothetical protein [Streptomyces cellulosae]|uniref:Secreted protein n=1 Tax=Streptomyces cellulosae TaxID=1968 RepID=A0ABW7YHM0_STRCE